jgi:CheY-like chemotaxis protein
LNAAPALLTGVRILLVDDHLDTLELMEMVLTHAGAVVVAATSAREALAHAEDVAVIVTDYSMPGETGLWLMERVVESPRLVPVILVTGCADRYAEQLTRAPFARVLRKPIDPWRLCEVVGEVVYGA